MGSDGTMTAAVLPTPAECENSTAQIFSPLGQTAAVEFQSTLQLLLDRARFLTAASGVAIAIREKGQLLYSASGGDCASEAGTRVDVSREPLRQCLQQQKPFRSKPSNADSLFAMAVPITNEGAVIGCFELLGHSEFADQDELAIVRLADLVNTALENRTAAVEAEKRLLDRLDEFARPEVASALWHPPESASCQQAKAPEAPIPAAEVQKCVSCGFPVSKGRRLCVECDQQMGPANPAAKIFGTNQPEQSWISVHGYTIASALVTAAAIAVILWLR
jgi:GAF domain